MLLDICIANKSSAGDASGSKKDVLYNTSGLTSRERIFKQPMVIHFITRQLLRASLCALVLAYAISAVEIKLSNGATFSGEFVSQNENFITIVKNGSNLSIAIRMIATITGLPQGVSVTLPQASSAVAAQASSPAPIAEPPRQLPGTGSARIITVDPGMELEITLQNSAQFKGTVITSDDRVINLQMANGSRVNIYKHIISGIINRTTGRPIPVSVATPATPPAEVGATVTSPPQPVAAPPSLQPVRPLVDSAKSAPSVSAPAAQQPVQPAQNIRIAPVAPSTPSPVAPQPLQTPAQTPAVPLAPPPTVVIPVPPVQSPAPPAPSVPGPVPPVTTAMPPDQNPKPPPAAVPMPVVASVPKKRADGKSALLLKNGTMLIGVIVAENERVLSFSTSDGTTITIIRRLIKEIDGIPYVMTSGPAAPLQDTALRPQRPSSAPDVQKQLSAPEPIAMPGTVPTVIPRVELKQGISIQELVDSLSSPSAETRSVAARQLGGMGQWAASSIPRLVALLADTAWQQEALPLELDSLTVQKPLAPGYEAGRSLSRIGTQGLEELKKTARAPSSLVRQRAVFGIGCFGTAALLPQLKDALKDAEPGVRVCAAWGLQMDGATDALIGALKDRDGDVRTYAAATLASRADPRSAQALIDALKDIRPLVRRSAVRALCRIRTSEAVPALMGALADASPEVRAEAAIALGIIADTAAVNALCTATRDNNPAVRRNALSALGEIRDPRAIPTLYTAIQETNDSLRPTVEHVLRLHTDIPLLIAALDDENGIVRENAAYILWLLTGKDLGQDKKAWSDWYSNAGSPAEKKPGKGAPQQPADREKAKKK
jgi:HEAT repeat protein/sRNA-binding regulator protein Hfq